MPKANFSRHGMPSQDAAERIKNFGEVALGYSEEMAVEEANRCLQCKNKPCVDGCPVNVRIPEFIKAMREGDFPEAARIMKSTNMLPAICGRVCPQETQCEEKCVYFKRGASVAIGRLERWIADWELDRGVELPQLSELSGKKVAVVGSGPSSLTAAGELARMGHQVTIFEALHRPGGVLTYGIPPFRLPRTVSGAEIANLQKLGVDIVYNFVVGKTATVDEMLADGYDAVFLGTGAGLPQFVGVPGENLAGVYSANEFLTRVNLMKAYAFPEYDTPVKVGDRVAVVGAGNVAMDSARCALRLGAKEVSIVYRRSRTEMPARAEEAEHAEEEGVRFLLLTAPTKMIGNDKGAVCAMECQQMQLGEPDASGRRRPLPMPGSEFTLEADTVVVAIGTSPNPLVPRSTPGLEVSRHGTVVVDPATGATTKKGVWAGGDLVTGAATVISAMGAGRRAAASIDKYLKGEE
ncbi:MAG: NADPH-dependent glutamate synthase [Bacteroidetes bacterium]|nr:NADPH-dependent glutamate synthase [Bacteroidota bacterium]MCL5027155.1 NADPH-dependent glutamate synthase [Chloroflexota bacterium]